MRDKLRILVLEDQAIDWEWLSRALLSRGYQADRTTNEWEIKQRLEEHVREQRYIGAILDVMVPSGGSPQGAPAMELDDVLTTGVRVCRFIRDTLKLKPDGFKIILFSILPREDLQETLDGLAVEYFSKSEFAATREPFFRLLERCFPRQPRLDR